MAFDPIKNFAKVEVNGGYLAAATTINLETGSGTKLPQPSTDGAFNLVWYDSTNYPDPSDDPNVEIIRVTTRVGDVLTVIRAQEGTSATNKNSGGSIYRMILSVTKKTMTDLENSPAPNVNFTVNQVSHALPVTTPIYFDTGSDLWVRAKADSISTLGTHVVVGVVDADNFLCASVGRFTVTGHGLTVGQYYYTSDTVAGNLTTTEPTISNPMIFVDDANTIDVLNYRPSTSGGNIYWNRSGGILSSTTHSDIVKIRKSAVAYVIPLGTPLAVSIDEVTTPFYWTIPQELDGMNLISLHALVLVPGITGSSTFQVRNQGTVAVPIHHDMLSTPISIISGAYDQTGATPYVIDPSYQSVSVNDLIAIDIESVCTTPPQGLIFRMEFQLP